MEVTTEELACWIASYQEMRQQVLRLDSALSQGDIQLGRAFARQLLEQANLLLGRMHQKLLKLA